ncbi:uroplakin-1b isoform X1 [Rhinolophus sinicus]|uniref:uroplakin-1b isoform X1 n=1 Tax=Rhinolophus sinicus TaxID=89399 RepID=UPI003D7B725D
MAKDDATVRCFQGLLIFGNVIVGMCGIALTAECIFFVSDQHSLYPLLEATDNDDIYGAAWIGMFVGICLFCLSVLGIVGIMRSSRKLLLAYFILMFIVYGFEVASCITAATQRDFFTPNLFLKQMLERYQNNSPPNNDDQWKNNGVTKTWDRFMLQDNCCGVNGPSDWQKYTSAFRAENNDADYPWPRQCCVMNKLKEPLNLDACKLGVPGYYHSQGCYELISGPMNRHAWGVAWFGFAILCWTGAEPTIPCGTQGIELATLWLTAHWPMWKSNRQPSELGAWSTNHLSHWASTFFFFLIFQMILICCQA